MQFVGAVSEMITMRNLKRGNSSLMLFQSRGAELELPMAGTAKGDEILFHIASQMATRLAQHV